jgi:hypothetical protein
MSRSVILLLGALLTAPAGSFALGPPPPPAPGDVEALFDAIGDSNVRKVERLVARGVPLTVRHAIGEAPSPTPSRRGG